MVLDLIVLGAIALTVILILFSNNSRSSVSHATSTDNGAENQIQDTSERIEEINRRAESSSSSRQSPDPRELENVISSMEQPLAALQASVKSAENDVQKIIEKAKRFRKLKKQEADQIRSLIHQDEGGELAQLEYNLDQLTGREDNLQDQYDTTIRETVNLAEDIETKIEEVENKQHSYVKLLKEEEERLLNDLKQIKEALEDVHHCLTIISQSEKAGTKISQFVNTVQEKHQLQMTEKEITQIEEALKELLHEETSIVEGLRELEHIEAETYEISERELAEIKEMLKEDNRIEHKLNEAREGNDEFHNHLSEDQFQKIKDVLDKLAGVLQNLGVEIEKEESKEEEIEEKMTSGENEFQERIGREEDKLGELESKTKKSTQQASDTGSVKTTYQALGIISPEFWSRVKEEIKRKGQKYDEKGAWKCRDFRSTGKTYTYASSESSSWGDANWLHVKSGEINPDNVKKIHYCSDDPTSTAKMVLIFQEFFDAHERLDHVFKFDVDEEFDPLGYAFTTNIAILYVDRSDADFVIEELSKKRKNEGLPPTNPYKNQSESRGDEYYPDNSAEPNFILKDGNASK